MRLRITFSKSGALRYTGHLDLHSIWERTVRRAGLPLAYTRGFHPGPKIQIASALPLGFIGRAEIVDIWLDENVGADTQVGPGANTPPSGTYRQVRPYQKLLQPAAPPGLTIVSVKEVDERGPALQTQVVSAEYEVTLLEAVNGAGRRLERSRRRPDKGLDREVAKVLAAASLSRERRGRAYDLRPLIEEISLTPCPSPREAPPEGATGSPTGVLREGVGVRVFMRLAAREGATGRLEEVLDALGIPFETTRIERTRLILKNDIK